MGLFAETSLPDSFPPYEAFRYAFGFVPALFRAQSLLPRVIEAEAEIARAVLLAPGALTRVSIPTLVVFKHGVPVAQVVGAASEEQIAAMLERALDRNNPTRDGVDEGVSTRG